HLPHGGGAGRPGHQPGRLLEGAEDPGGQCPPHRRGNLQKPGTVPALCHGRRLRLRARACRARAASRAENGAGGAEAAGDQ
ncbi:unnamed protein product, partial [Effrenium voratum]